MWHLQLPPSFSFRCDVAAGYACCGCGCGRQMQVAAIVDGDGGDGETRVAVTRQWVGVVKDGGGSG